MLARHRLEAFEAFVASTAERELRKVRDAFVERQRAFTDLEVVPKHVKETLVEIQVEHESLSRTITASLAVAEERFRAVELALREDSDLAEDCPDLKPVAADVGALVTQLSERAAALRTRANPERQESMTAEAQELRARKVLGRHEKIVLDEIERKRKYAAYEMCLQETRTNPIARMSTILTRKAVTEELRDSPSSRAFKSSIPACRSRDHGSGRSGRSSLPQADPRTCPGGRTSEGRQ